MGYLDNNGVAYLYGKIKEYIAVQKPYSIAVGNGEPYSVWKGTYAEYCAITPDESTIYIITTPPYDAEIEYLESSGTQYINTGVLGSLITRFKIKAICYEAGDAQNTQLLGGTESGASTFFGARKNSTLTPANWYCRDANKVSLGDPHSPSIIDATINSSSSQTGTLEIDTTITNFYSFSDSWGFPNEKLLIFGGHYSRKSPLARCYYLQFFTNNILIMDMIPVRIGNVGYMYDKVSGKLFGNAGTGNFILGPDK